MSNPTAVAMLHRTHRVSRVEHPSAYSDRTVLQHGGRCVGILIPIGAPSWAWLCGLTRSGIADPVASAQRRGGEGSADTANGQFVTGTIQSTGILAAGRNSIPQVTTKRAIYLTPR